MINLSFLSKNWLPTNEGQYEGSRTLYFTHSLVCECGDCCLYLLDSHCPWPSPSSKWQALVRTIWCCCCKCYTSAYSMHTSWEGHLNGCAKSFCTKNIFPTPPSHTFKHVKNALYFGGTYFLCINSFNSMINFWCKFCCRYSTF